MANFLTYIFYESSFNIVYKNINWIPFILTCFLSLAVLPLHSLVINSGGPIGQEIMYTVAIIPVIIFSRYKKRLTLTDNLI